MVTVPPKRDKEEIRTACDMLELCNGLGLKRGSVRLFHCPWPQNHSKSDTHPSFAVSLTRKTWRCFVCTTNPIPGKKGPCEGDCFDLVMAVKKIPFWDAVNYVADFNDKVAKKMVDLGRPDYTAAARARVLAETMKDYMLFSPFYSLLWWTGKSVDEAPEAFQMFNKMGISNITLKSLEFKYLDNIENTISVLRNKFDMCDMKPAGIFDQMHETFKLKDYPLILPFKVGDTYKSIQGWKKESPNLVNLRNDYFTLLNEKYLLKQPLNSVIVVLDDTLDGMSYIELGAKPNEIAIARGSTRSDYTLDFFEHCKGKRVKLIPKTNNIHFALELRDELVKNRIATVEVVSLQNVAGANSVNEWLCKTRRLI